MASYVIGIDIGTGSTKALGVDPQGKVIASAQVHYPTLHPSPGYCEQAPEIIWQAFVKSVRRITAQIQSAPEAIILSSAMHSVLPVDKHGKPLANLIIWADNRSSAIAQRIIHSSAGEMLYEQNGTPLHSMTPLCKLVWLRENAPALYAATHKFISIKEYIWFNLFNTYEVDYSIASATGMMDIENFSWNVNALDVTGLTEEKLSGLVSPDHTRNNCSPAICEMLGVSAETKFLMGASDGCLANLGSFATTPGIAALTIGTSGAVRVASKKPVYNFESMTFNYRLDAATYICGGPSNNGGAALKWYVENFLNHPLAIVDDYDAVLKTLKDTPAGADGLIFLPYLFGERAPIYNSEATGVFFGIKGRHTQAHFTRAVIEGISMALYDIANHMINSGLLISQVHVSGGFVRSSAWLQILADIFNKKICLINADDASALGAAYLGLKKLGRIIDYDQLKPAVIKDFLPQPECVEQYQYNFKMYRDLYKSLKNHMVS